MALIYALGTALMSVLPHHNRGDNQQSVVANEYMFMAYMQQAILAMEMRNSKIANYWAKEACKLVQADVFTSCDLFLTHKNVIKAIAEGVRSFAWSWWQYTTTWQAQCPTDKIGKALYNFCSDIETYVKKNEIEYTTVYLPDEKGRMCEKSLHSMFSKGRDPWFKPLVAMMIKDSSFRTSVLNAFIAKAVQGIYSDHKEIKLWDNYGYRSKRWLSNREKAEGLDLETIRLTEQANQQGAVLEILTRFFDETERLFDIYHQWKKNDYELGDAATDKDPDREDDKDDLLPQNGTMGSWKISKWSDPATGEDPEDEEMDAAHTAYQCKLGVDPVQLGYRFRRLLMGSQMLTTTWDEIFKISAILNIDVPAKMELKHYLATYNPETFGLWYESEQIFAGWQNVTDKSLRSFIGFLDKFYITGTPELRACLEDWTNLEDYQRQEVIDVWDAGLGGNTKKVNLSMLIALAGNRPYGTRHKMDTYLAGDGAHEACKANDVYTSVLNQVSTQTIEAAKSHNLTAKLLAAITAKQEKIKVSSDIDAIYDWYDFDFVNVVTEVVAYVHECTYAKASAKVSEYISEDELAELAAAWTEFQNC